MNYWKIGIIGALVIAGTIAGTIAVMTPGKETIHKILLLPGRAEPDTLVIKLGEMVEFDSRDGQSHEISTGEDHGPHGEHATGTIESGLFGPDEGYRVRFSKIGIYDFRDHLNENINFKIAVYQARTVPDQP